MKIVNKGRFITFLVIVIGLLYGAVYGIKRLTGDVNPLAPTDTVTTNKAGKDTAKTVDTKKTVTPSAPVTEKVEKQDVFPPTKEVKNTTPEVVTKQPVIVVKPSVVAPVKKTIPVKNTTVAPGTNNGTNPPASSNKGKKKKKDAAIKPVTLENY